MSLLLLFRGSPVPAQDDQTRIYWKTYLNEWARRKKKEDSEELVIIEPVKLELAQEVVKEPYVYSPFADKLKRVIDQQRETEAKYRSDAAFAVFIKQLEKSAIDETKKQVQIELQVRLKKQQFESDEEDAILLLF